MGERRRRLQRLVDLVASVSNENTANYCAQEISCVLQEAMGTSDCHVLYSDAIKGVLRASRSERLDSRKCAGETLKFILACMTEMLSLETTSSKEWAKLVASKAQMLFHVRQIEELKVPEELNASCGLAFVYVPCNTESQEEYLIRQRRALLARIGLDLSTSEAIQAQERQDDPTKLVVSARDVAFSSREANQRKRKREHDVMQASRDFKRSGGLTYVGAGTEVGTLFLYQELCRALIDPSWHCRQGALFCLPPVARALASLYIANPNLQEASDISAEEIATVATALVQDGIVRCLTVLAIERFADFETDAVVSPVHEALSITLSSLMTILPKTEITEVVEHVVKTLEHHSNWQARHGAAMTLLDVVKGVELSDGTYSMCLKYAQVGLQDPSDDVRTVAAKIVCACVQHSGAPLVTPSILLSIEDKLWSALEVADDFSTSPSSILDAWIVIIKLLKNACRTSWISCVIKISSLPLLLMHGVTAVRGSALAALRAVTQMLLQFFEAQEGTANNIGECTGAPLFDYALCLNILFEMLILDESFPEMLNSAWAAFQDMLQLIPIENLLGACRLDKWLALAATTSGHRFDHSLLITAAHANQEGLDQRDSVVGCRIESSENLLARLEKVAGPGTRRCCTRAIGKVLSTADNIDCQQVTTRLHELLKSDRGCDVITAAQTLFYTSSAIHANSFLPSLREQVQRSSHEIRHYEENKMHRKRASYECRQLAQEFYSVGGQATVINHRDLMNALYKARSIDIAHDAVNAMFSTWEKHVTEVELEVIGLLDPAARRVWRKEQLEESLAHCHEEVTAWFTARRQIDVEVLASLSAAIVSAVSLKCCALPKRVGVIILPLLNAIKSIVNVAIREFVSEAVNLLIEYCAPSIREKIISNLCVYIGQYAEKGSEFNSVAKFGGACVLRIAANRYGDLSAALFKPVWDCIEQAFSKAITTSLTIDGALELLDEIVFFCGPSDYARIAAFVGQVHHFQLSHLGNEETKAPNTVLGKISSCCQSLFENVMMHVMAGFETGGHQSTYRCLKIFEHIVRFNPPEKIVPYAMLTVSYFIHALSDYRACVRAVASSLFAWFVPFLILEKSFDVPSGWSQEQLTLRNTNRELVSFLAGVETSHTIVQSIISFSDEQDIPLRGYQAEGISWLVSLQKVGLHGMLCDDMGLGKTLQALFTLAIDRRDCRENATDGLPSLVLCPSSVIMHWHLEITTFVGAFLVPVIEMAAKKRAATWTKHRRHPRAVYVMSYNMFRRNINALIKIVPEWHYAILDEGHVLGNTKSVTFNAVKLIRAKHRLVLSGTPIQNNVVELYPLFEFLMPGFLEDEDTFRKKYFKPMAAVAPTASTKLVTRKQYEMYAMAIEKLHKKISPFFKRREKGDVLQELPPKIIQDRICSMPGWQREAYDILEANNSTSDAGLSTQQKLRLACTHPCLLTSASLQPLDNREPAKLVALRELLKECGIRNIREQAWQHKCVIFAQYRRTLDLLASRLCQDHFPDVYYERLDGAVGVGQRQAVINRFNESNTCAFLLATTGVAGLGINLTSADTVIFLEHDWNPQKDIQAMDRVHRLGQEKVTNVYRLLCASTIETRIMNLQQFKIKVSSTIMAAAKGSGGVDSEGSCLNFLESVVS